MKEAKTKRTFYRMGHGWYRGGVWDKPYSPTIDTGTAEWHTLILEIEYEENTSGSEPVRLQSEELVLVP